MDLIKSGLNIPLEVTHPVPNPSPMQGCFILGIKIFFEVLKPFCSLRSQIFFSDLVF